MVEGLRHYLPKPYSKEAPYNSEEKSHMSGQRIVVEWARMNRIFSVAHGLCLIELGQGLSDSGGQAFMFLCCGIHPLQG